MLVNKPPMGWNSWNTFAEKIDEKLIMEMADIIVEQGYKDAGYEYVVIDDCWALKTRDSEGKLVPDPKKFPNGIKKLSDYIHAKGLKFGMYSCAGVMTCAGYPSSYGHEFVDAKCFAEWGVDFLKYDFCHFPQSSDGKTAYLTMANALRTCGRDIVFSACNWGTDEPWNWMRSVGAHMYRSTGDIMDNYKSFSEITKSQEDKFSMSAPQCYNDLDMLVVGMYGNGNVGIGNVCSDEEYAMHFVLWCLFGTPLMMGCDLRKTNKFSRNLMQNRELIAINQDDEARPPVCLICKDWRGTDGRIYFKLLSNNEYVLAFANFEDEEKQIALYLRDLGIPYSSGMYFEAHDVFTGEAVEKIREYYVTTQPAHSIKVLKGKFKNV